MYLTEKKYVFLSARDAERIFKNFPYQKLKSKKFIHFSTTTTLANNISCPSLLKCYTHIILSQGSPTWCPWAPGRPQGTCRSPVGMF